MNPRDVKWPQDTAGFLYKLKHEGIKAAERQAGNPQKHEDLMRTLSVIAKFAIARYEMQHKRREALKASLRPKSDPGTNHTGKSEVVGQAPGDQAVGGSE